MFIRTSRLLLRPPFAEDAGAVYAAIASEPTVRMLASLPWPYLAEHARAWCDRKLDPIALDFVIALPGERGPPIIGAVGVNGGELGYWIAESHRRRGYASEAVKAVLDAAAVLGHGRIRAAHFLDNPASGIVLTRAGFAETGAVHTVHSLGRGGELVLARRYSVDVRERAWLKEAA